MLRLFLILCLFDTWVFAETNPFTILSAPIVSGATGSFAFTGANGEGITATTGLFTDGYAQGTVSTISACPSCVVNASANNKFFILDALDEIRILPPLDSSASPVSIAARYSGVCSTLNNITENVMLLYWVAPTTNLEGNGADGFGQFTVGTATLSLADDGTKTGHFSGSYIVNGRANISGASLQTTNLTVFTECWNNAPSTGQIPGIVYAESQASTDQNSRFHISPSGVGVTATDVNNIYYFAPQVAVGGLTPIQGLTFAAATYGQATGSTQTLTNGILTYVAGTDGVTSTNGAPADTLATLEYDQLSNYTDTTSVVSTNKRYFWIEAYDTPYNGMYWGTSGDGAGHTGKFICLYAAGLAGTTQKVLTCTAESLDANHRPITYIASTGSDNFQGFPFLTLAEVPQYYFGNSFSTHDFTVTNSGQAPALLVGLTGNRGLTSDTSEGRFYFPGGFPGGAAGSYCGNGTIEHPGMGTTIPVGEHCTISMGYNPGTSGAGIYGAALGLGYSDGVSGYQLTVNLLADQGIASLTATQPAACNVGGTSSFEAKATYTTGKYQNINPVAHLSSGTPAKATVAADGTISCLAAGTVTLTAAYKTFSSTTTLTISP